MKKTISLLLCLTMLLTFTACETTKTPNDENDTKTVYALTGVTMDMGDGEQANMKFDYDAKGRILEYAIHSGEDIMQRQTFEYNDEDKTSVAVLYNGNEEFSRITSTRNDEGKVISNVIVTNGVTTRSENTFDEEGKPIRSITYSEQDEVVSTLTYLYDDNGNKICERTTDANDTVISSREYKYDDEGNMTELTYSVNGNVVLQYTYKYENGKLTERSGEVTYRFSYNESGNIHEVQVEQDGENVGTMSFSYIKMSLSKKDAEALEEYMGSFLNAILSN